MQPTKDEILTLYFKLFDYLPINWEDKESIKQFKSVSDTYSKKYGRLTYEEQGWISEEIKIKYLLTAI